MFRALHYTIGDFEKRSVFLPNREYGLALDALVKGCADVLVTQLDETGGVKILLGRRCVEPQPDWWRNFVGDTPQEGAARNIKREIGLPLDPSRFSVVANYSFAWRMRQQEPATNGTADISTVLELRLTKEEADSINFDCFAKSEYRDAKWIKPQQILDGEFNPALQQAVRDLLTKHAFEELLAVRSYPAVIVAARARRMLAWYDATPTTKPVKVIYDAEREVYNFVDPVTKDPCPRPTKPFPSNSSSWLSIVTPRLVCDLLVGPLIGVYDMAPILPPLYDALLGNLSQSSALLVYAFVDPLQLQIVAFFSAVSQRPPVVIFAFWDSLQGLINLIQIIKLSLELVPIKFSERELEVLTLMSHVFDEIPSHKITRILRRCGARWAHYPASSRVVTFDNGIHDELVFVVEGSVSAYSSDDTLVIEARPGAFLAESSLSQAMLDEPIHLTDDDDDSVAHLDYAIASTTSLCLVWPVSKLSSTLKRDDELRDAFRQALAVDLCRKIVLESQRHPTRPVSFQKLQSDDSDSSRLENHSFSSSSGSFHSVPKLQHLPSTLYTTVFGPSRPKNAPLGAKEHGFPVSSGGRGTSSRRTRRKQTVLSVMGFIESGSKANAERRKVLVPQEGYDSMAKPPAQTDLKDGRRSDGRKSRRQERKMLKTRRPSHYNERTRMLGAALAKAATVVAVAMAVAFVCYLAYVQGPSSTIGNGSQAIITGAFAINDPLTLQIVSFIGSSAQACFFIFRSELIWSSVAWSSAQALVNFVMAIIIKYSMKKEAKENIPLYSDRELFVARCIQRAVPLAHDVMQTLTVGANILKPKWRKLAPGEAVYAGEFNRSVSLITDGRVRVLLPSNASYLASSGALLGGRALVEDHRSDKTFDESAHALEPCELISWQASDLKLYLNTNPDARLAFAVLAASTATVSYLEPAAGLA